MKNDAKFGKDLTCQFKIDMKNLTNFDQSTRKSKQPEFKTTRSTKCCVKTLFYLGNK